MTSRNPLEVLGFPKDLVSLIGDKESLVGVAEDMRKAFAKVAHPDLNPEGQGFLREVNVSIDALKNASLSVFDGYRQDYLRMSSHGAGNLTQERIHQLQEELALVYGRVQVSKNRLDQVTQEAERSKTRLVDWFRDYLFWERVEKVHEGGLHILEIARLPAPVILCLHWPIIYPCYGRVRYLEEEPMVANNFNYRFGVLERDGRLVTIPNFGEPGPDDTYPTWRDCYDKKHRLLVKIAKRLQSGESIAQIDKKRSIEYVIGGMEVKDWPQPREGDWSLVEREDHYISNSIIENDDRKIYARLSPLKPYLGLGMLVIIRVGGSWFHRSKGSQIQKGLESTIQERGILKKIISIDDLIDGLEGLVQFVERKRRKVAQKER